MPLFRINVGCGSTPTKGWRNYDNSLTVRLSRYPFLGEIVFRVTGSSLTRNFANIVQDNQITWANAVKRIPLPDSSVDVLYTSHMVEHLDREEIKLFLREAQRVLAPGAVIRIVVPDIRKLIDQYNSDKDADEFIERTRLATRKPKTIVERLRFLIIGNREHLWMYDAPSMLNLLSTAGFGEARVLPPGETTITEPGELNLRERESESLYVEARKTV